jgi:hypothetical protein
MKPPGGSRPSTTIAVLQALAIGLLAAAGWAFLRGILGITVGSVVVAGLGGWGIGVCLRRARLSPWLAAGLGAAAWLAGLLLAWLLAMAILPGSSRTLPERLAATPFPEWLAPQLGLVELLTLAVFVAVPFWTVHRAAPETTHDPWG